MPIAVVLTSGKIGVIQQVVKAGLAKDANLKMTVTGEAVCDFCRGDVPGAAAAAGLKSLTIVEAISGRTLYWFEGMRILKVKKP